MTEFSLTGGCLCGGVRYEISAPLIAAGYCHCTRCQRRSGTAASVQGQVLPGSFHVTAGEDLVRAYDPGDGGYVKAFCSRCGSALWSRHPVDTERLSIRLGTFDTDPGARPAYRQFVSFAAAWEEIPEDGLPRFPDRRPAA